MLEQKLKVSVKATLEGCTDLKPVGDDFNWMFKVKCSSCREEHPNWMGIDATEQREISGSRGEANLVWRCQMCKREHTISFDDSFSRAKAAYTLEDSDDQKFAALAVLECRGCEITAFDPRGIWSAKGAESNTRFDEIELSLDELEWNDYDEKAGAPVSIMDFESKIDRA
ncbi:SPOSA6832_02068 [Sporobolomyces salmonicolor]|uniref:SPOSA6832_02068-mRNA-1:cds n=1 Tax=Sporidiobolus salmonicolor TaxID=5005 RepID=A0A0D6EKE3_SPOSA|nr:SPOSA6832_02068 [Sporobolomyces salmonicolor]